MEFRAPPRENYKSHDSHSPSSVPEHQPRPAEVPAKPAKTRPRIMVRVVRRWWKLTLSILLVAAVVWLAYGYVHTKSQLAKLSNPKTAGQSETQQLISEVGKLVDLPTGENPTLATVNDAAKLKSQTFFADAHNGDKVLIYNHNGKAVLYRPSTKKVIQYSNLKINGS